MGLEIERKFLVVDDSYKRMAQMRLHLVQGYLSVDPRATVRIRIIDDRAFLTVKSKNVGCVRGEWEYEIPHSDACEMLEHRCGALVDKYRYIINIGDDRWEVDEFMGDLQGLVVAEIEVDYAEATFVRPEFVGAEVTGDPRYYNSSLSSGVNPLTEGE